MPETQHLVANADGIASAARLLREGGHVAFPTETVYGLGADATNGPAVAGIFKAKGRPSSNPLIVHVPDIESARRIARFDAAALQLADSFWPGALTLVLPLRNQSGIPPITTAGLDTVAIRAPDHAVAQDLLRAAGCPIAAPSANPSGRTSPTNARHVIAGLSGLIDAVLDAGPCAVGIESTIVATEPRPALLRSGGIPAEAIEACLDASLADAAQGMARSPGQLASHYAPRARMRLNADAPRHGERLLGFGPVDAALNLSPTGNLAEAAANLFSHLHTLDAESADPIAVSPVPEKGLGRAINDRLRRAAAPRAASD